MEIPPALFERIIFSVGGALISLIGAYFVVGRDLSFVKGQLSQLMGAIHKVDRVEKSLHVLEISHVQLSRRVKNIDPDSSMNCVDSDVS